MCAARRSGRGAGASGAVRRAPGGAVRPRRGGYSARGGRGFGRDNFPAGLYRRAAAGYAGIHAEARFGCHRRARHFRSLP